MGVMRCGLALAISKKAPDGGVHDAVHDTLGSPYLAAVVDAKSVRSGFFPDAEPERTKVVRCQVFREHSVRSPGLRRRCKGQEFTISVCSGACLIHHVTGRRFPAPRRPAHGDTDAPVPFLRVKRRQFASLVYHRKTGFLRVRERCEEGPDSTALEH